MASHITCSFFYSSCTPPQNSAEKSLCIHKHSEFTCLLLAWMFCLKRTPNESTAALCNNNPHYLNSLCINLDHNDAFEMICQPQLWLFIIFSAPMWPFNFFKLLSNINANTSYKKNTFWRSMCSTGTIVINNVWCTWNLLNVHVECSLYKNVLRLKGNKH